MSTILGIISLVSLGIVVYFSYRSGGEAAVGYGFTGFLALLFSFVGLGLGIATVRDHSYFRLFPMLGTILNLLSIGFIGFLLYMGSRM